MITIVEIILVKIVMAETVVAEVVLAETVKSCSSFKPMSMPREAIRLPWVGGNRGGMSLYNSNHDNPCFSSTLQ